VCTYRTEQLVLRASAKGPAGWMNVTDASVYFDHPAHFRAEHALSIDFLNPSEGPSARVAIEMNVESARALAQGILDALASVPADLLAAG